MCKNSLLVCINNFDFYKSNLCVCFNLRSLLLWKDSEKHLCTSFCFLLLQLVNACNKILKKYVFIREEIKNHILKIPLQEMVTEHVDLGSLVFQSKRNWFCWNSLDT